MNAIEHARVFQDRAGEPRLALTGITKSFGSVRALNGVTFDARAGEVHAIVGENGAGKSTLIACAAGVLEPDAGTIGIGGRAAPADPAAVRELGLSVAFQHPALAPDLTVFENLKLARPELTPIEAEAILARVTTPALAMNLRDRAGILSLAQAHVLEIARALTSRPRILVLDEPTEPFQDPEVRHLFALIGELKAAGTAIVYISHRLHEVMSIADRVSVLRDGELVETRPASAFSPGEIVDLIVGKPLGQVFPSKRTIESGAPILTVARLTGQGFQGVDLEVRPGEIIGLAGVEGQGQRDFIRALAGLVPIRSGDLRIGRDVLRGGGVAAFRAQGIGFVPDDRHSEGLVLSMSIKENCGLGQLAAVSRHGLISDRLERDRGEAVRGALRVKTPSVDTPLGSLSGGNQQKVLLGREIACGPRALLVDEPTKGVDVGSRSEIYARLPGLAEEGVAVIVASADGVEIEGLCDRVLVFSRGAVVAELAGADVNDARITEANLKAQGLRDATPPARQAVSGLRAFAASDLGPAVVLLVLSALVAGVTQWTNADFLSAFNVQSLATLTAVLAIAGMAQLCVVLTGGIDLSVGPLAGLVVVLASFLLSQDAPLGLGGGCAAILGLCLVVGLIQGALVEALRLPPIVVTLATYTGLQGLSLVLRPSPAGVIGDRYMDAVQAAAGPIPFVFPLAIVLGVGLEIVLLRHRIGRSLRAIGSSAKAARLVGLNRTRLGLLAFAASGLLAGLAGMLLAAQVGIGSATSGVDYTLMSVTAVVLGGAQITGGRGSFLATLCGALFVETIVVAMPFLKLTTVWQYWIIGGATFLAASLFSRLRASC